MAWPTLPLFNFVRVYFVSPQLIFWRVYGITTPQPEPRRQKPQK